MDKCEVCLEPVPEHLRVCSRKCAGELGGSKKVPKGLAKMSTERRQEISALGVEARRKHA